MHVYTNRLYLTQIKDCNVVASKLILVLDDLLWVLTDSQLKAMVQYAKSLSEAMEKSAQQRKSMATEDQVRTHDCLTQISTNTEIIFNPSVCFPSPFSRFKHFPLPFPPVHALIPPSGDEPRHGLIVLSLCPRKSCLPLSVSLP